MSIFVYAHWLRPGSWTHISRVSRYLDTKPKSIFTTVLLLVIFITAPLFGIFGVIDNNKLDKIQERSLLILLNDYEADAHNFLDSIGGQTLALRRLKYMLLEVYKCITKVNAPCLHNLVNSNTIPNQLRTSKLEQPLRRTSRYGLRHFSFLKMYLKMSSAKWRAFWPGRWVNWS